MFDSPGDVCLHLAPDTTANSVFDFIRCFHLSYSLLRRPKAVQAHDPDPTAKTRPVQCTPIPTRSWPRENRCVPPFANAALEWSGSCFCHERDLCRPQNLTPVKAALPCLQRLLRIPTCAISKTPPRKSVTVERVLAMCPSTAVRIGSPISRDKDPRGRGASTCTGRKGVKLLCGT